MDDNDFLAAVEADNTNTPVAEAEPVVVEVEAKDEPEVLELVDPVTPEPVRSDDAADGRLAALLDERDKRKAAEAELARYREQQAQAQPVQMPDAYEDPEGFAAFQQSQQAAALYQINLRYSERLAKVEHGAEAVDAAKAWGFAKCETDPHFNAKVAASDDPIGLVVAEYKRDEIASNVSLDEFAQFKAWREAQGQLQQVAQAAPTTRTSTIPPRSLASAPSAGNMLTEPVQTDDEIFGEIMPKR